MNKLAKIILSVLGWNITFENEIALKFNKKCVYAVAPHTSYWDGFLGKVALEYLQIKFIAISADWLFYFPLKYIMTYLLNAFPVSKTKTVIKKLKDNDDTSLVICPEGQLAPIQHWPNGYYRIAKIIGCPIVPAALDYKNKLIVIGEPITDLSDEQKIIERLNIFYTQMGNAKYPEKFIPIQ